MALLVAVIPSKSRSQQARAEEPGAPGGPEIEAVRFPGAVSLDHAVLQSAIASRPSRCKTPFVTPLCLAGDFDFAEIKQFLRDTAQVATDAERLETLYEAWGYPDASVSGRILPQRDGDVVIEFTVEEGEPIVIRSIEVRGLESLELPLELPDPLPLAPGDPYALPRLESTLLLIRQRLAERGHATPGIEISGDVERPARAADLVLDVDPGPIARFGEVTIESMPPLDAALVRRAIAYQPGERFRPSALERTERRLYDLPITERAAVRVWPIQRGDTVVPTTVLAEPRRVHGFGLEGTVSSTDCLTLAGRWSHRSFFGGGRLFVLGVAGSNLFAAQAGGGFPCGSTGTGEFEDPQLSVEGELWQPALFGDFRWTGTLSAFVRREAAPNVYIQRGWGGRIAVSRQLGPDIAVRVSWAPERNELDASAFYFCASYGVCSADGIERFTSATWLAPVELAALWASSPARVAERPVETGPGVPWQLDLTPSWRFTGRLAVQAAGATTGSDHDFARALGEATATRVLGRAFELAGRVRAASLFGDDVLPPQVRLFSGGVNTVRGVAENLLGPYVAVSVRSGMLPCGGATGPACAGEVVDPNLVAVRPLGGQRLAEVNVEVRWWASDKMQVAGFVDFGRIEPRETTCVPGGVCLELDAMSRITPGIGIRLITDIGPIRLDVAYDGGRARRIALLRRTEDGGVASAGRVLFDPFGWDDPGPFREFVRRLQLQMSIGQAF